MQITWKLTRPKYMNMENATINTHAANVDSLVALLKKLKST